MSDPLVLRGKPHIVGTRIPVGLILGHLAADQTIEQLLQEYEDVKRESIKVPGTVFREQEKVPGTVFFADALGRRRNAFRGPRGRKEVARRRQPRWARSHLPEPREGRQKGPAQASAAPMGLTPLSTDPFPGASASAFGYGETGTPPVLAGSCGYR